MARALTTKPSKAIAEACDEMVRACERIVLDATAYDGESAPEEVQAAVAETLEIVRRLNEALQATRTRLRAHRRNYVEGQLARLRTCIPAAGLKLHLGGGSMRIPDWLNVDLQGSDLRLNLLWGLPFPDGCAPYVFFCLALEHFRYRPQALAVLGEIRRLLAPRGVLRIVVPDIGRFLEAYSQGADGAEFFTEQHRHWPLTRHFQTPLEYIMAWAGYDLEGGNFFGHKMGYDFATLERLLVDAGFQHVVRSEYMASAHPALRVDSFSEDAGLCHNGRSYNLFVEATCRGGL